MVVYKGKRDGITETFSALDWLARLVTHIPNKGEQLVRYYGYYSNKARGLRKKAETEEQKNVESADQIPIIISNGIPKNKLRKSWARLIRKIYKADPLICPKCNGPMRILSIIDDDNTIKKILIHLKLWTTDNRAPPSEHSLYIQDSKAFGQESDITTYDSVLKQHI